MKNVRLFVSVFLFISVVGILLPRATADPWDKETRFTSSEPVQIAGTLLPAGTYWFKLEQGTQTMVIIRDENRERVLARVSAISTHRVNPLGYTEFTYWENSSSPRAPLALRAWFYPGDRIGYEFPLKP